MPNVNDCNCGARLSPHNALWLGQFEDALGGLQCADFTCNGETVIHVKMHCETTYNDGDYINAVTNHASIGGPGISNVGGGTTRPVFKEDQINGFPAARFDGTSQRLLISSAGFSDYTLFAVVKQNSLSGDQILAEIYTGYVDSTPSGVNWELFNNQPRIVHSDNAGAQVEVLAGGGSLGSGWMLLTYRSNGTNTHSAYKNGVLRVSSSISGTLTNDVSDKGVIGAHRTGLTTFNSFASMDLAELIVFNSALSDANREEVENCLMEKYGLE